MKKAILTVVLIALISSFAFAGLYVGPHAEFYLAPNSGNATLVGIKTRYSMNDYFALQGSADTANYSNSNTRYTVTSLGGDIIYHFLGTQIIRYGHNYWVWLDNLAVSGIDPYVGTGGGIFNTAGSDSTSRTTTAVNALAGLTVSLSSYYVELEVKYTVPDTRDMKTGFYSIGCDLGFNI